ncbi:MAG: hypothetical protein QOK29_2992, partial [Rhodospirillaceae bacterium]|nr:hypothetical protein [Rhodospirillaceae bacterium]
RHDRQLAALCRRALYRKREDIAVTTWTSRCQTALLGSVQKSSDKNPAHIPSNNGSWFSDSSWFLSCRAQVRISFSWANELNRDCGPDQTAWPPGWRRFSGLLMRLLGEDLFHLAQQGFEAMDAALRVRAKTP